MVAAIAPIDTIMSDIAKTLPRITEDNFTVNKKATGPTNAGTSQLTFEVFTD